MKSKALLLMVMAGFLPIFACTNPIMEQARPKEGETPAPAVPVTYTVAFESNGGSPVEDQVVAEGEKATRPDNPTKKGCGFVNWYDNGECAGDCYDFETPVTDDITLYAEWSEIVHTVTFMDGETELSSQPVGEGGTASKPVPTKDGYTFDDWYGDPELTVLYDFDTPVTGGFTLYAKWTLNTYTVTFMDGDTVLAGLTRNNIPHGSTVSRPSDPTKEGHTFDDWYSDPDITVLYDFDAPVSGGFVLYAKWEIITNSTPAGGHEMVWIPAGTFTMGSPADEPNRNGPNQGIANEIQREVTLTGGFYMGKYQVTQAQYEAVMGSNPSTFQVGGKNASSLGEITDTANFPVDGVFWYEAIVFCNKLSINEGLSPAYSIGGSTDPADWGTVPANSSNATWNAVQIVSGSKGYRLPTEAQWEYACRAGTATAFNWGTNQITTDQANYNGTGDRYNGSPAGINLKRSTEVGSYAANAWGLYDMHGNLLDWCWDRSGTYEVGPQTDPEGPVSGSNNRVIRGGSWLSSARYLRSAYRSNTSPRLAIRDDVQGFRLSRPSEDSVLTLTNIDDITTYLAEQPANTAANPVPLYLALDLGAMSSSSSNWRQLLTALNTAGKFVNLDLSACTIGGGTGTEFNPAYTVVTGKNMIVSIALPVNDSPHGYFAFVVKRTEQIEPEQVYAEGRTGKA